MFLCTGGTIYVTDTWFDSVSKKPRRVEVYLLKLLKYGFVGRGMHDCVERLGALRVVIPGCEGQTLIYGRNMLPETRTWPGAFRSQGQECLVNEAELHKWSNNRMEWPDIGIPDLIGPSW